MSKINKIKLSGTTYDVEDANASKTVELTQAQYDALVQAGTVDPNTFYIITDAQAVDLSEYWTSGQTQSAIDSAVSGKADYSAATVSMFGTETISSSQTTQSINITFPYTDGVYYISGGSSNMFSITNDFRIGYNDVDDYSWKSLSINNTGDTSAYTFTLTNDYFYFQTKGINRVRSLKITLGESATVAFTYKRWADVEVAASTVIEETILPELSGKQDTLSAGTGIDITNNVISATGGGGGGINSVAAEYDDTGTDGEFLINVNSGQSYSQIFKVGSGLTVTENGDDVILSATGGGGGGKAVSAGTNISITTGETADTINCTLNISNGTGIKSIKIGDGVTASGILSFAQGDDANASGNWSTAFGRGKSTQTYTFSANSGQAKRSFSSAFGTGIANSVYGFATGGGTNANGYSSFVSCWYTNSNNNYEAAFGSYNNSVSASTTFGDSGNTLFSVGNGTADNARHNAFEIRQNGDIYLTLNGQDIKLQDQLGGGSITIDPSLDSGSTNAVANSAITTAINAVSGAIPTTTSAVTSGSTAVVESGAVYSQLGGLKLVKLTQTEYDNLGTKDSNTLYVITNS